MPWTSFMVTLNKNCRVRLATLFSDTDSNKVRMYEYFIRVLPIWWRIMMSIKNAVQLNSTWAVWLVWADHISVQALIVSIDSSDYEKYINRAIPQECIPEYQPLTTFNCCFQWRQLYFMGTCQHVQHYEPSSNGTANLIWFRSNEITLHLSVVDSWAPKGKLSSASVAGFQTPRIYFAHIELWKFHFLLELTW